MERLVISGVDVSHSRLVELTKLADQAKPFYDWIEVRFQWHLDQKQSLNEMLQTLDREALQSAILDCYAAKDEANLPLLFDGVGRNYSHHKACYYLFSWLTRCAAAKAGAADSEDRSHLKRKAT